MIENIVVGIKLIVYTGNVEYVGEVTAIEEFGFWLTENKQIEEFVAFDDVDKIKII